CRGTRASVTRGGKRRLGAIRWRQRAAGQIDPGRIQARLVTKPSHPFSGDASDATFDTTRALK
ncbi:MAG: hypothetical protein ACRED2_04110, partial [Methylocella sp.]